MATIDEIRTSLVFAGTVLTDSPGKAAFAGRAAYEEQFDGLQKAPSADFDLPWRREAAYENLFWKHYLKTPNPASVRGLRAWSRAVPFRGRSLVADAPAFAGIIRVEPFFYPFGLALVFTANGKKPLPAADWIDGVVALPSMKLSVGGSNLPGELTLVAFANEWLQKNSAEIFGNAGALAAGGRPYTVTTVVRGGDVDDSVAPAEGGEIHRLLFGAATLDKNWRAAALDAAPLAKAVLPKPVGQSPGDVVFVGKRGRAHWTPSRFTKPPPAPPPTCYHRNQVFAALQVESLSNLASSIGARLGGGALPSLIADFEQVAASQLASLYTGDTDTYRSIGIKRQIDERGDRKSIEAICGDRGVAFPALV